jgi:hypothetical protein
MLLQKFYDLREISLVFLVFRPREDFIVPVIENSHIDGFVWREERSKEVLGGYVQALK